MQKIYYNQLDARWKNHPYPASGGYENKTCGTSGCGTTCGAMIVSSCREYINPAQMCDISRENGYRVPGGTADGLFSYISRRWNIEMKTLHSSFEAHQACKDGWFVVICCSAGLWTTRGHFILAVGANNTEIEIYDPYLYAGKFNSYGRQGKVRLEGVSAWVEINTFKAYSNAQRFYAFKVSEVSKQTEVPSQNIQDKEAWVNTQSQPLNVRESANGKIIGSLVKGTKVIICEIQGNWARINQGWVSLTYLSYSQPSIPTITKIVKVNSSLNVRSGAGTGSPIVGSLKNGDKVTVYETRNGWSRIGEGKWVSAQYLVDINTPVQPTIQGYRLGRYKVNARALNVRSGAGTNYSIKKTYKNGTVFDTYEIRGSWAKTPSGWCCLDYCKLLYKY